MAEPKSKHRRMNHKQRASAFNLVAFWYRERAIDGNLRYHPDKSELTIVANIDSTSSSSRNVRGTTKELTARGTETRTIDAKNLPAPRGVSTDPFAKAGTYQHNAFKEYTRKAMLHIIGCSTDTHRALEMNAAGWSIKEIGDEIGCSQNLAQSYIDEGIFGLVSYRILFKPSYQPKGAT